MSQYTVPGGGIINSGDKLITRKVVVATGGSDPSAPGGAGRLTNVTITAEPGGIKRGVFEYTQGGGGDANYNAYGKKIELLGGSREVPIYKHPNFESLTSDQIKTVQKDVEEKKTPSGYSTAQDNLYQCLIRQIEYFLAPSLVARISEIESGLPSISGLCKVDSPSGVSSAPNGSVWLLTGISATPVGDKYEVTREYTMSAEPQATLFLYD
jgi:hypothetical protein